MAHVLTRACALGMRFGWIAKASVVGLGLTGVVFSIPKDGESIPHPPGRQTEVNPVHARMLETWSYSAGGMQSEKVPLPTLEQIEAAVRRLDRRVHPIMFLWASDDPARQMVDENSERLEVLGGDGLYWIAGTLGRHFQRRLLDPEGGDTEVAFWGFEIEQGFGAAERHVCRDVKLAIRAARYFGEHGDFDPSLSWE